MAHHDFRGLGDLLGPALARWVREGTPAALGPLWTAAAGPALSQHVRALDLSAGVLTLEADTPRWQKETAALESTLLPKLASALGQDVVRRIVVQVAP